MSLRRSENDLLSIEHVARLSQMHKLVSTKHVFVKSLPPNYPHKKLMDMPEPPNNYSCSLLMAKLALDAYGIRKPPDREIVQAIGLTEGLGADQWPLFEGLTALGIMCLADEGKTIQDIGREIATFRAFCIMSHQYYDSTLHQWKKATAGHYSGACCISGDLYSADASCKHGITKIPPECADALFYDIEMTTGRLVKGFGIIVPIRV